MFNPQILILLPIISIINSYTYILLNLGTLKFKMSDSNKQQSILQQSINQHLGAGAYQVLEPLKRGGDGYVFKAKILKTNELRAIKNLPKTKINFEFTAQKSQKKHSHCVNLVKKAKNEITIHEALKSQFIVKLYCWFEDQNNFFLMLDYYPRGDLGEFIKQHPSGLPVQTVRTFANQIAKGISVLHQKGVIHRDIKPQNILLGNNEEELKICDFSCATKFQVGEKVNGVLGTLNYMAPEMLRRGYDQKVDVWSLGCLLFYLGSGQIPFKIQNKQIHEYHKKVNENTINSLTYPTNYPSSFADLLKKMLVADPKNRLSIKDVINHPFLTGKDHQIQNSSPPLCSLPEKKSRASQSCENIKTHTSEYLFKRATQKYEKNATNKDSMHELENMNPNILKYSVQMQKQAKKTAFSQDLIRKKLLHKEDISGHSKTLSPLNCEGLIFQAIQANQQQIIINRQGFQKKYLKTGKTFKISPDGSKIELFLEGDKRTKKYTIADLPKKYHDLYNDFKSIVEKIRKDKQRGQSVKRLPSSKHENTPYNRILNNSKLKHETQTPLESRLQKITPTFKSSVDIEISVLLVTIKYKIITECPEKSKFQMIIKDSTTGQIFDTIISKTPEKINELQVMATLKQFFHSNEFEQDDLGLLMVTKSIQSMRETAGMFLRN